jgi:hypothetical protein
VEGDQEAGKTGGCSRTGCEGRLFRGGRGVVRGGCSGTGWEGRMFRNGVGGEAVQQVGRSRGCSAEG